MDADNILMSLLVLLHEYSATQMSNEFWGP